MSDASNRRPRGWGAALAVLALSLCTAVTAAAAPQLIYKTEETAPGPNDKHPAPTITITVINGAKLPNTDAYKLVETGSTRQGVKATKIVNYIDGPEEVGVVVLVFGDANYLNAKDIKSSLQQGIAGLATAGPQGSTGMVMIYGSTPDIIQPLGPLADIGNVKLEPKEPAQPKAARDLAAGLAAAMIQVDALKTPRKALVVLGDGIDGEGATAASGPLRDIGKKLEQKKIAVVTVTVQVDAPALGSPVRPEEPQPTVGPRGKEIPPSAAAIGKYQADEEQFQSDDNKWRNVKKTATTDMNTLSHGNSRTGTRPNTFGQTSNMLQSALDDRFYLEFPGIDKKTKGGFKWDGKEHPLMLKIDGADTVEVSVAMTPKWSPATAGGKTWLWVLLGVLGLGGVGGAVVAMKKKPGAAPVVGPDGKPLPVAADGKPLPIGPDGRPMQIGPDGKLMLASSGGAPGAAGAPGGFGAPPQPPKAMKTMFVGADGSETAFPMVGWMVHVSPGPKYLKFTKLKSGVTRIGSNPTSDIVMDGDPLISGDHAIIVMSPDGYIISDNNSSNGVLVNDIKITKTELMDNDLILMGKSVLKFKSVF